MQKSQYGAKFTNDTVYKTYISPTIPYFYQYKQNGTSLYDGHLMPNITSLTGFTNLISPQFAKGVR